MEDSTSPKQDTEMKSPRAPVEERKDDLLPRQPPIILPKDRQVELPEIEGITGLRPGSKGRNFESFIGNNEQGARVLIKLYKQI